MARIHKTRHPWSAGDMVGVLLALAVMPTAFRAVESDALWLLHDGWEPLYVWAIPCLLLAGKIAVADTLGFGLLVPLLRLGHRLCRVLRWVLLAIEGVVVAWISDFWLYRREVGLQREDRDAVLAAFEQARCAACTLQQTITPQEAEVWPVVINPAADAAVALGSLAMTLPSLTDLMLCDRTLIAPQPLGGLRVHAIRRLPDGCILALWHDPEDGFQRVVAYSPSGEPVWVYHWSSGLVERIPASLARQPSRTDALVQFDATCCTAEREYRAVRSAMLERRPKGHRLGGCGGMLTLRDRRGRLDNPSGLPAALAPSGTPLWALNGHVLPSPGPDARARVAPGVWLLGD